MKNLFHLALATLVVSIVACQKQKVENENAPQPPKVAAYKIPLDSLKKQAVALGAIFGDPATKSRSVTAANAIAVNTVLGTKHMTKSYNTDPDLPQAYVINFSDDQGFAILVDDKRVGNNILAYSESGNIDQSTDNPGVLIFMDQATEYIEAVSRGIGIPGGGIDEPGGGLNPGAPPYFPNYSVAPSNWGSTGGTAHSWIYSGSQTVSAQKSPLLKVNWGQGYPYNQTCPNQYPTGCAATALVQILSYYKWPTSVSVDGGTWNINWTQAIAGNILGGNIHHLMHDAGIKLNTTYAQNGSSSSPTNVKPTFQSYGYSCSEFSSYDDNIVNTERDNNRPIYIIGYGPGVGHGWVLDGYIAFSNSCMVIDYYTTNNGFNDQIGQRIINIQKPFINFYPHCNWGWEGKNNGYFKSFDTENPFQYDNSNNNDKKYWLQNGNQIIYNIKR